MQKLQENEYPILVFGAGVGGCAIAIALLRAGFRVRVFEAADRVRFGGDGDGKKDRVAGGLGLAQNALRALAALGGNQLLQSVLDKAIRVRQLTMLKDDATILGHLKAVEPTFSNDPMPGDDFVRWVDGGSAKVLRADLLRALFGMLTELGVEVALDSRFATLQRHDEFVEVQLASGESVRGSLVIGADGVHSAVRSFVVDSEAEQRARYTGFMAFGGLSTVAGLEARCAWLRRDELFFMRGDNGTVGLTHMGDDDWMWWSHVPQPTEPQAVDFDSEQHLAQARALFGGFAEPVPSAMANCASLLVAATYDVPHLSRWSHDRVVLLGDAAHAMSTAAGQGAAMALEDAVVLARALCLDEDDLAQSLQRYECTRKPRVEPIVAQGHANDSRNYTKRDGSSFFARLGDWMFGWIASWISASMGVMTFGKTREDDALQVK